MIDRSADVHSTSRFNRITGRRQVIELPHHNTATTVGWGRVDCIVGVEGLRVAIECEMGGGRM